LLEVYKKLRAIVAAASDHEAQEELLGEAKHIVQEICVDHVAAADTFIRDPQLSSLLKADTEMECQILADYLGAAKRFNLEINSRAKDRVVSFGEKLSCRFMTCLLKDRVSLFLASFSKTMLKQKPKGGGCSVHRPGRHHAQ
jgi:aspartate kinase